LSVHEFPSVSANYHAPNLCDTLRPPDGEDTGMEAAHYTVTSVEPYVLSSERWVIISCVTAPPRLLRRLWLLATTKRGVTNHMNECLLYQSIHW